MHLIDTHAHLCHGRLRPQSEDVLRRARQAGVDTIICAAADLQESINALNLARRQKGVYCLAGVHPHSAKDAPEDYLLQLERLAGDENNVAIGEIGLDYHYNFSPPADQRRVFAEQLDLAERMNKKIVIHTREAFEDTLAILRNSGIDGGRVLFHSCTQSPAEIAVTLDYGAMVSFSGIVTFPSAVELQESALRVPADRLMVETDAPFLSPEPVRKIKTNEPAHVAYVARFLANLRGQKEVDLASRTTENAIRFFSLPADPA